MRTPFVGLLLVGRLVVNIRGNIEPHKGVENQASDLYAVSNPTSCVKRLTLSYLGLADRSIVMPRRYCAMIHD
ncbi:hypothetical protein GE09DRAFT_1138800 [Coniochaeta sp. 2T2.1]|nr:hypothetical protein GE09DRAFT_1138800 [Coniochaeta sp. 2T2.1]